jgi:hypothetical protein
VATYTLYRKVDGGAAAIIASGLTAKEYKDGVGNNGTYNYAITATDKAGLTSGASPDSADAVVVLTGPAPVSITINSDALYTSSADVTLTVGAVGAVTMQFSCDGTTWDGPVGYGTTAAFNLNTGAGCAAGAGNGLKTVYVAMIDVTTINTTYASDFITLGTAPTVTVQDPDGIAIDPFDPISITFSEAMDLTTINSVTVQFRNYDDDVQSVASITQDETDPNKFIIEPWWLAYSGHYYISISGVKSAAGIPMANYPADKGDHDFTTSDYVVTPPTIISWAPGDGVEIGINVSPQENVISVTFSERIWDSDINTDNIQLLDAADAVIPLSNLIATFITGGRQVVSLMPAAPLTYNTDYHITVANVHDWAHGDAIVAWDSEIADGLFSTIPEPNGDLGMWATTTQNKSYALNDGYWPNGNGAGTGGWAWTMHVTVPIDELDVSMKFDNWTGVGGASIPAANYIRYYSDEAVVGQGDSTTKRLITAPINLYGTAMTINPALDMNLNMDGIQIDIHIETKVPTTSTAGGYSTQYGIQSLP